MAHILMILGLVYLGFLFARRKLGYWRRPLYTGNGPMLDLPHGSDRWDRKMARMQETMERIRARMDRVSSRGDWFAPASSGNRAYDDYRAEFDQFMADRRERPFEPDSRTEPPTEPSR